jgi:hypothetical protein
MYHPNCYLHHSFAGSYGDLQIDGSDDWQNNTDDSYNVVHINCLSLLCRRLDVTPEQWWLSFYGPESEYRRKFPYAEEGNKLKEGIDYYDMWCRNGQDFGFSILSYSKKGRIWWDPDGYEDCNWIFASPSTFPRVPDLPPPFEETSSSNWPNQTAAQKVFSMPDLLFTTLDFVVPYISKEFHAEMVWEHEIDNCPEIVDYLATILSILQVNKRIYNWIIQSRQDLFFRIVWQMGFMLPAVHKIGSHGMLSMTRFQRRLEFLSTLSQYHITLIE